MAHETFSDRLRAAMAERGLEPADLVHMAEARGKKLGKSQVSQYVSGKVVPRANVALLLASVLGVDEGWLVTGQGARAAARPETAHEPVRSASGKGSPTMREFKKSNKLDNVLYDVRGPVGRRGRRAWSDDGASASSSSTSATPRRSASARPTR